MYKTEFCLNNHTNGRNTNLNEMIIVEFVTLATGVTFAPMINDEKRIFRPASKAGYKVMACSPGIYGSGSHFANFIFTEDNRSFDFKVLNTSSAAKTWDITARVVYINSELLK